MPNQPSYPAALDQIRRCLESIAKLEQRLASCQADAERQYCGTGPNPRDLDMQNAYLAGGLPVIIGEAVDLAQRALAQLPAAAGYDTMAGYDPRGTREEEWPVYRLDVPVTVMLTCPHCGSSEECDVEVDSGNGVAFASIDRERCDGCRRWLCPSCPTTTVDGDTLCQSCHPQEKSDPQEAPHAL